ncbi:hypothetical protein IFM89_028435 [Coptis chinensis]|uniref:Protein kinase domain-containing protein n=1 Tax=Coptis chinensis TaxID=261450 RepID=A0A835M9X6_9MAGN|nr:hypothetical protein IFM89_028435 [Coptis chinensis]
MTTMSGTLGYLAPEWLSLVITEKVDVFNFGIVVIEVLCGRKNADFTQTGECIHLLRLLEENAKENQLHTMIDNNCDDLQLHREEVIEMMKVSVWCLQCEHSRRPSMSAVVEVLEGVMNIEPVLNYNFSFIVPSSKMMRGLLDSTPLLPSVLSGPR